MRRILEIVALCLLLFIWAVTASAVLGPNPLPGTIPTHFNLAGEPDGWGTPGMLWVVPAIATGIYLMMSLVARYPSSFNIPMQIHPSARRKLEGIALRMLSWLKAEMMCLFAWIQYWTVRIVRLGHGRLSAVPVPLLIIAVFGTIGFHIWAMRRAARLAA